METCNIDENDHSIGHRDEVGCADRLKVFSDVMTHPVIYLLKFSVGNVLLPTLWQIAGKVDALEHGNGKVLVFQAGEGFRKIPLRGNITAQVFFQQPGTAGTIQLQIVFHQPGIAD